MIANLMMYEHPQLTEANKRYWLLIRKNLQLAGIDSPEHLSQDAEEFFVWNHPELILSQTCGMPYRIWLQDKVELVGTPDYEIQGCPPGFYRSALVVRASDPRSSLRDYRDAVFAFNQTFSQSGYAAPFQHLEHYGFWFENRLQTGQHLKSALAVSDGKADIASLDAMSWRLMGEHDAFASRLRVLGWTEPTPGLPLITAKGNDVEAIYEAVKTAIYQLDKNDRSQLGLKGIVRIAKQQYTAIPDLPV